ncbi:MAG TPA: OsmC family protein [Actinomycetota bacterium]
MGTIEVRYDRNDRYVIRVRGHELVVDQPVDEGGEDTAPTPTELFVAGLASCVAFYGGRYLRRHGLEGRGFGVDCSFGFATDRPTRVGEVTLRVHLPAGFPEERRPPFLAVLEHCTVHSSILRAPDIRFVLEAGDRAA